MFACKVLVELLHAFNMGATRLPQIAELKLALASAYLMLSSLPIITVLRQERNCYRCYFNRMKFYAPFKMAAVGFGKCPYLWTRSGSHDNSRQNKGISLLLNPALAKDRKSSASLANPSVFSSTRIPPEGMALHYDSHV